MEQNQQKWVAAMGGLKNEVTLMNIEDTNERRTINTHHTTPNGFSTVMTDTHLFIFGGFDKAIDTIMRLDYQTEGSEWEEMQGKLLEPSYNTSPCWDGGNSIYVTGGSNGSHQSLALRYDIMTDTIHELPNMNHPRSMHCSIVLSDWLYVIHGEEHEPIERLNLTQGEWEDMEVNSEDFTKCTHAGSSVSRIDDNTVLLLGGWKGDQDYKCWTLTLGDQITPTHIKLDDQNCMMFYQQPPPLVVGGQVYSYEYKHEQKFFNFSLEGGEVSYIDK